MRIAVDISWLALGKSGIPVYIREVLSELQRIDQKNEYFLFELTPSGYTVNNPKWKLKTSRIPNFRGYATFWFQCVLPILLIKNKIDCLWAPVYFCPFLLRRKMRVLLTIYDCTNYRFPYTLDSGFARRFKYLYPYSIRRADGILTISEYVKKELQEQYLRNLNKKIYVGCCGKPAWNVSSDYQPGNRSDFLFFPGNFEPRKNILTLVKALEILFQQGITVPLQISGPSGWGNNEIHAYLNNSSVKKSITFLGFLSEQDLINKYSTCKALVFPSLYEGFGMPVLEALSLDCLVLTSKNTVMQEICGKAAVYFDPNNPHEIADAIKAIFNRDFDRNNYLCYKDPVLEKYSWKETAEIVQQALVEGKN